MSSNICSFIIQLDLAYLYRESQAFLIYFKENPTNRFMISSSVRCQNTELLVIIRKVSKTVTSYIFMNGSLITPITCAMTSPIDLLTCKEGNSLPLTKISSSLFILLTSPPELKTLAFSSSSSGV